MKENIDFPTIRKLVIKEFVTFLKENKAYTDFKTNFASSKSGQTIGGKRIPREGNKFRFFIDGSILIGDAFDTIHEYINYSFTWGATPQGHAYWSHLNNEWSKRLYEVVKKYVGTPTNYKRLRHEYYEQHGWKL